jgi:DNA-binding MarR family transcriptional regulator
MKLPMDNSFIALINEILRVNGRIRAVFEGVERETGLSTMQLSVLASVAEAREPLTVSEVGRSLGHQRQVIQRATNELVDEGLLCMVPNPRHKRAPLITTTPAGEALKARADERAERIAQAVLEHLDPKVCDVGAARLRLVRGAMDRFLAREAALKS